MFVGGTHFHSKKNTFQVCFFHLPIKAYKRVVLAGAWERGQLGTVYVTHTTPNMPSRRRSPVFSSPSTPSPHSPDPVVSFLSSLIFFVVVFKMAESWVSGSVRNFLVHECVAMAVWLEVSGMQDWRMRRLAESAPIFDGGVREIDLGGGDWFSKRDFSSRDLVFLHHRLGRWAHRSGWSFVGAMQSFAWEEWCRTSTSFQFEFCLSYFFPSAIFVFLTYYYSNFLEIFLHPHLPPPI